VMERCARTDRFMVDSVLFDVKPHSRQRHCTHGREEKQGITLTGLAFHSQTGSIARPLGKPIKGQVILYHQRTCCSRPARNSVTPAQI
jgi:hypothetical protein